MKEAIILSALTGFFVLISYTLGLINGQKLQKKEVIKMPAINPVKTIRAELEQHSNNRKQEIEETINYNIDNYDGTELGQKDIPM